MGFLKHGRLVMRLCAASLWVMLLPAALSLGAEAPASPGEYQVKAVFLFNFTQFVEWPESAFRDPESPLVIGVLGEDPFGSALDATVGGETVNGRPLVVRRYRSIEELDDCHVLFINLPPGRLLTQALARTRQRNVLTVSDTQEFARAGGVIQFVKIDNKIRLQINIDAAKLANLSISSKLLRPARIVRTG